jgi:trans-aconitate methyltransferase
MTQSWSPEGYARDAAFVPALGAPLVERLAPKAGERILDLGCGDGVLTERLIAAGAQVVGVDRSREMIEAARRRGVDAHAADAAHLTFDEEFDAVFSNAVLHWVLDADAAAAGVRRALKRRGRFVAEFGGHTNVAAISVAIRAVMTHRGYEVQWPWYYPSADEYRDVLERNGLSVDDIRVFPRPTRLDTGMQQWLRTFAGVQFSSVPEPERETVEQEILTLLRPSLCDSQGRWTADYARLQVVATRPD